MGIAWRFLKKKEKRERKPDGRFEEQRGGGKTQLHFVPISLKIFSWRRGSRWGKVVTCFEEKGVVPNESSSKKGRIRNLCLLLRERGEGNQHEENLAFEFGDHNLPASFNGLKKRKQE